MGCQRVAAEESVEVWKCGSVEVWKCGNVRMHELNEEMIMCVLGNSYPEMLFMIEFIN